MTIAQASVPGMEGDPSYDQLKRHIIDSTGLAYYLDKDVELVAQLGRRMAALGIADCGTYLSLLHDGHAGESEHDALAEGLTIGETFFFRHQEVFDAIRNRVLPELIDRNRQQRRLRVWSAGCATGAEPYSLAILLRRFAPQIADWDVTIVGTDINRDFLAQGQRGEFNDWAFRSASDELKHSCFVRSGQTWRIKDEYRRGVLFQYHNLVQHPFPSLINSLSAFDLVLCRNVMIYFEPAIVGRLVGQFYDCLVDGGWFVVGPTEPSVELFRAFQTLNSPGAVLYRKGPRAPVSAVWSPLGATPPSVQAPVNGQARVDLATTRAIGESQVAASSRLPYASQRASRSPANSIPAMLAEAREKLNGGQSEAAAELCRKLMTAQQLNPLVHFYHALAAEQQGHQAEIEPALRRAIYLDRDFVLAHYHLGLVLQRKRDGQAAQRSFRNVLVLLQNRDESEIFPDADGLTVGALLQLTRMHLEVLLRA
jgi:chemotaxis protein methyltransferase CheR